MFKSLGIANLANQEEMDSLLLFTRAGAKISLNHCYIYDLDWSTEYYLWTADIKWSTDYRYLTPQMAIVKSIYVARSLIAKALWFGYNHLH